MAPHLGSLAQVMRDASFGLRSKALSCFMRLQVEESTPFSNVIAELLRDSEGTLRDSALRFFEKLPLDVSTPFMDRIAELLTDTSAGVQCAGLRTHGRTPVHYVCLCTCSHAHVCVQRYRGFQRGFQPRRGPFTSPRCCETLMPGFGARCVQACV